jgi:hypothetical protein
MFFSIFSHADHQTTTTVKLEATAAESTAEKAEAAAETTRAKSEAENDPQAIDFVKVEEADIKSR